MSGGHWGYLQQKFEEAAEPPGYLVSGSLRLLGQIEHELDWGYSCDTCLGCARLRVLAALDTFFDFNGNAPQAAMSVARNREIVENFCDKCLSEMHTWGRREGAKPTLAERDREVLARKEVPVLNRR